MAEIRPLKIEGVLIACEVDDDGNVVNEWQAGNVRIYRPQFGDVEKIVDQAWREMQERDAPDADLGS